MKLLKKILGVTGVLLIIIIIAGFFFLRNIARKAIPDYNADVAIEGLTGEVTVIRDAYAVPSVYAENEEDLYRAVGYVMAQDRLWQMDLLRRVTTGRLTEIFGPDLVNTDLLMRSLRITEKSGMVLQNTGDEVLHALEAFADGVNQFINHNAKNLPPEFSILGYSPEPWEPVHSINLVGYMAWDLNMGWSTEAVLHKLRDRLDEEKFRELVPDLDMQTSYVHPERINVAADAISALRERSSVLEDLGVAVFSASNNWAVSGAKSTTGSPVFANDMHLGLFTPGIWYQMHHVAEGSVNVTGVVLPGQPFVISGHNERIAWGMTNVMLDDVDFYLETVNPSNPHQYKYMGEWRDMEVRNEMFITGKRDTVFKELLFTHRGPVISDFKNLGDQAVSMRWTGNEYSNEVRSVYMLNRAGNWEEFREALTTFLSVSQNINYADVDGNIGIQTAAGIPLRDGSGIFIVSGEDDTYDWKGFVPFDELPYTYNPPKGFVASANNRTIGDDYPYYISHWFDPPNRYDRIVEMLTEKERLSPDDFKSMLGDKKSMLTEKILPGLLHELKKADNPTINERRAMEMLRDWDLVYDAARPEPLIFEKFYMKFIENLLREDMGEELYEEFLGSKILVRNIVDRVWDAEESAWFAGTKTDSGPGTFTGLVTKSFIEAIEQAEHRYGPNVERWAWGDAHTFTLNHPMGSERILDIVFNINRGPYSPGGSFHTVCPYSYNFNNPFVVNHGASQRHIYSTANWDNSFTVIPTGASGIPASDHYCDQTELYVNDEYRPDPFSRTAVESGAVYRMKLLPAN
ncbi:MAG: penicillin acylase family protein [Marinilabiliales bacterium]|nr:MAG: penicillin acylase family protein [Marinilabiliales bacterium]